MKTDELIDALAEGLAPAPSRGVPLRMAAVAAAGAAVALALVGSWLGLRPDLALAAGGATFWLKAAYAVMLAAAGFFAVERLSRPAGSARLGLTLGLVAMATLVSLGAAQLATAAPPDRLALWLGSSWNQCPIYILALAAPMLALALLVMRRLAPTRLRLAGAAAGLFSGGVAATAYGLHCPETAPAFVATWYSLGVALSVAAGALVGPWALRWR